jgi:hypothetical protein
MAEQLIGAAVGAISKEVAQDIKESMTELKEFGNNARQAKEAFGQLTELATSFGVVNPNILPMKTLINEITSQTFGASMGLSAELLTLLGQPATQAGLRLFTDSINLFLYSLKEIVQYANNLFSLATQVKTIVTEDIPTASRNIATGINAAGNTLVSMLTESQMRSATLASMATWTPTQYENARNYLMRNRGMPSEVLQTNEQIQQAVVGWNGNMW